MTTKKKAPKTTKSPSKKTDGAARKSVSPHKIFERRRHPRFLLTREQFREVRTGKVYPVYDLSLNGLSVHIEKKEWTPGMIVPGILNLHPDSIEISPRFVGYYGDRAALKIEVLSIYGRGVLQRSLSPGRLGESLQLIRENLPVADYWFHGVCNTDLLLKMGVDGKSPRAEFFFSNFYCAIPVDPAEPLTTGVCQSMGQEKRDEIFLADEPVKMESLGLYLDNKPSADKIAWAKSILESSPLEPRLKTPFLKRFENP